jgi:hypothetical protein
MIGASGVIAPGIKSHMDEIIAGFEYEADDRRSASRTGTPVGCVRTSPPTVNTYIIANPGEWDRPKEERRSINVTAASACRGDVVAGVCRA